ncbi:hypothetical protein [Rhizobium sp. AU243]|uniref:hypothetical protein n=1 Tax=Rhizobium sp. AU243 TaxID=2303425 RepID=UPI002570EA86|nr:hypothetical protein [Rhizobium sp. AU243]
MQGQQDTDQYKNVSGAIGLSGGGLNSVGFSYEKKDKQGETRTTLDASGDLNATIRDADKAAAEQILASINKDASKYQEITKDSYTKLSGELDVEALRNLKRNLDFALRYSQAQDAAVPGWIAAKEPQAIEQYREAILYGGATPTEAEDPSWPAPMRERIGELGANALPPGQPLFWLASDTGYHSTRNIDLCVSGYEPVGRLVASWRLVVKPCVSVMQDISKHCDFAREPLEDATTQRLQDAHETCHRFFLVCRNSRSHPHICS